MAPPTVPGSYGRVLRLSPEGLATLTPDMTPRLTNLWKLSEIAEVAPAPLAAEPSPDLAALASHPLTPSPPHPLGRARADPLPLRGGGE